MWYPYHSHEGCLWLGSPHAACREKAALISHDYNWSQPCFCHNRVRNRSLVIKSKVMHSVFPYSLDKSRKKKKKMNVLFLLFVGKPCKPERIAFTWWLATSQSGHWKMYKLVWWLVLISHRVQNAQRNILKSDFLFSVWNNKVTLRSAKSQQCFCCSSRSRWAAWQVSARCLAFCAQSGLAISSTHTRTQTHSSSSSKSSLTGLYAFHTSRAELSIIGPGLVLGSVIPAPQCVCLCN